jgi:hypothetical protein
MSVYGRLRCIVTMRDASVTYRTPSSRFTKHVAVSFHHARGAVIQGEVEIKYVASQLNLADLFTKALVPVLFHQHRNTLGVMPRPVL